jgi:hypothetical protein
MKSLADNLPPEFAAKVSPEWRKNEVAYWAARDQLVPQYQDQWIGYADGTVVASGKSAVDVLHAARQVRRHAFVTCVGREYEPCQMRQVCDRLTVAEQRAILHTAGLRAGWDDPVMDAYDSDESQ